MTRRFVPLVLSIVFALLTARFGLAQRGGGRGGTVSGAHSGAGQFGAGSGGRGFSPSFSRSPQFFRSPTSFSGQARPHVSSPFSAYNRQPYPSYRNRAHGDRGYRNRGYRNGVGYPYPYYPGYGLYGGFVPDVLDYPFDSLFDEDGNGYGNGPSAEAAPQTPYPQESYAPPPPEDYAPQPGLYPGPAPEGYAPQPGLYPGPQPEDYPPQLGLYPGPPYSGPIEDPSQGYRPPYQNSSQSEPPAAQPATALIFRDGRPRELVHNYALTKTTLYVLDAGGRKDIPLADLDLPATIAANRSVGIEFSLPSGH